MYKNMNKRIVSLGNIEIEKRKFHYRKNLILLEYVAMNKILLFSMISSGEKNYK